MKLAGCLIFVLQWWTCSVGRAAPAVPATMNNAFAFSMLAGLSGQDDNLVFSPFSVWSALAMTSAGAEGETLREMQAVLHLSGEAAHDRAGDFARRLQKVKGVELRVANKLWGQTGFPFREDFLKLAAKAYGGELETIDFRGATESSRAQINAWVAKQTGDKIKSLLQKGILTRDTSLVLTNAIYFNGKWVLPFKAAQSKKRDFILASGTKISVQSMVSTRSAQYLETPRLQAVRLPYQGGSASMIIVLPRRGDALRAPGWLDAAQYTDLLRSMKEEKNVVVQLPLFEIGTRKDLAPPLSALGMKRAFRDDAQFGAMCEPPVSISDVIHEAWIKVAEEGTEATAATAVVVEARGGRPSQVDAPKLFIADRPFLFFIVEENTHGVIFAGRLSDPRTKS